jgi:pilus assembly protein Flp/PilA
MAPEGIEMNASIGKFLREEDGITALEYGILAALVATALAGAFLPQLKTLYAALFTDMTTAVAAAAATK